MPASKTKKRARSRKPDAVKPRAYKLRLYVAGQTPKSIRAFANLKALCEEHLKGSYQIQVIDLLENPRLARGDQIVAIPTLVRTSATCPKDHWRLGRHLKGADRPGRATGKVICQEGPMKKSAEKSSPAGTRKPGLTGKRKQAASRSRQAEYVLRLYISGSTSKSALADANIKRVCEQHLKNRYDLEVIDIYQQAHLARDQQIVAVPTLIKRLPHPLRRLIGDMSDLKKVLFGLDLKIRE
jgi:circadian clock protein KaiB